MSMVERSLGRRAWRSVAARLRRLRALPLLSPVALRERWQERAGGHPVAAERRPSLRSKRLHPHVLRHSCAMSLLQGGVDTTVIALWLGHADVRSTQPYLHADLSIKERALALTAPPAVKPGRYLPPDAVLAEIDAKVDMTKLEETLMREGLAKFAEPQKALLALVAKKRASA